MCVCAWIQRGGDAVTRCQILVLISAAADSMRPSVLTGPAVMLGSTGSAGLQTIVLTSERREGEFRFVGVCFRLDLTLQGVT